MENSRIILHSQGNLNQGSELPSTTEIALIWGIRWAHGNRSSAGLRGGDNAGGGGGGLAGCSGTGEGEDDDEGADDVFHDGIPQKLYFNLSILLDRFDGLSLRWTCI